jgi:fructose-bisphosphate aldolase class II
VPAALVFNESPNMEALWETVRLGYGLVMFSDEELPVVEQIEQVRQLAHTAHVAGICVEGEVTALQGVGGALSGVPADAGLTGVQGAVEFVERPGVDALPVAVGQMHLHGRQEVRLDL